MSGSNRFLRSYGGTDFITGLRAIAATMVVFIHTGAFIEFGSFGQALTSLGKYGVDIFFVISGFTIAKTFSEASSYRAYITRRVWRIAPLYYILISVSLLLISLGVLPASYWMQQFGVNADLYNWLMHISFLSYFDYRIANSLLSVEWSIPIEIFWYVVLPLILFLSFRIRSTLLSAFILLFLTAIIGYGLKKLLGTSMPVKWSPIAYGHLFVLGAYAYNYRVESISNNNEKGQWIVNVALLASLLCMVIDFSGRGEILALVTVILLAKFNPFLMRRTNRVLTNKSMLFVGSISYSVYLVHPLVISTLEAYMPIKIDKGIAFFILTYGITLAVSSATYIYIEKPTNRLGRLIANRFR